MVNDGEDDEEVQHMREGGDPVFDRIPNLRIPMNGEEEVYNPDDPDSDGESNREEEEESDVDTTPHVRTRAMRQTGLAQ
jgi:hypothetical protein